MTINRGESLLRLILRPGSVFYFQERKLTSGETHYFIVLNHRPLTDDALLLVVSSSQVGKVQLRRQALPGTVVLVPLGLYRDFSKESIVDCNEVWLKSRAEIAQLLDVKQAEALSDMPLHIVEQLRQAVRTSPLVDGETKKRLDTPAPKQH